MTIFRRDRSKSNWRSAAVLACGLAALSDVAEAAEPLTVVTFGTSLTARGGWQDALRTALRSCSGRDVVVHIVAKSGASSRWALGEVGRVSALKPEIVLVEFATNDAALDRLMLPSWSEENLRAIVDRLRADVPHARIALMTMNPALGMRGMMRPFLETYYAIPRKVAAERGLLFVDNYANWRAMPSDELAAALPDGNHPKPEAAIPIVAPNVVKTLFPDCRPPAP